ncbi:GntR family transcriptional regulator [Oerskovia enterophila]|uniref:HTH gntR-type domain-containing protein n=1 Tax=Oerskovia enterophila TaxID=43678 RepID=A0ABX2Y8J5_9CELL|nr:GntR family transcriptional regulator [Oerskovia enterophila]OCI32839.1 hypothetical protein OERS_04310 [Oerskovia enterophila]
MARKPVYVEITEWLRAEAGRRGAKALMPTIAEVCEKFDVSGVQTVRNAYDPLLEEGVVVRLDSPRRWAVADNGKPAAPARDVGPLLDEIDQALARVSELVAEVRAAQAA